MAISVDQLLETKDWRAALNASIFMNIVCIQTRCTSGPGQDKRNFVILCKIVTFGTMHKFNTGKSMCSKSSYWKER